MHHCQQSPKGRADARFVRGTWLGKTTDSDEEMFATDTGVYTTRTVKRVPETEQRRADTVKSCQGAPWDRFAGRLARRPRKTAPQAPPVATPPAATASERPSEDASERRSAKAQNLTPPVVLHVLSVPHAKEKENEPSPASVPMDTDHGGASLGPASDDHVQVRSSTPAPSSPDDQTHGQISLNSRKATRARVSPNFQTRSSKVASSIKSKGFTTVDAEVPCEFSVEDVEVDETTEGVDKETVKAILAGKKKEFDAMEAFGIFDVCEKLPKEAKIITMRCENVPTDEKWICRFVAREFTNDDPELEVLYTSGSTAATSGGHACGPAWRFDPVPRCRKRALLCRGRRGRLLLASQRMGQEVSRQVDEQRILGGS